jgi:hypothetical protein
MFQTGKRRQFRTACRQEQKFSIVLCTSTYICIRVLVRMRIFCILVRHEACMLMVQHEACMLHPRVCGYVEMHGLTSCFSPDISMKKDWHMTCVATLVCKFSWVLQCWPLSPCTHVTAKHVGCSPTCW